MKNSKAIIFKLNLAGKGVVNFDSCEQRFFTNDHCGTRYYHENIKVGKKAFKKRSDVAEQEGTYLDDNGIEHTTGKTTLDYESTLKISSACLRHAMFANDYNGTNPSICYVDGCMADFITSIPGLLRGYMYTIKDQAYVFKSPITITSAIEIGGAVPYAEIGSQSGKKEKGGTSMYYTEEVGDTLYEAIGVIDFKQMQFMSDDDFFGRVSFKSEWLEGDKLLEIAFKNHYGGAPYKEGYFSATKGVFGRRIAEHGIKFDNSFVKHLVCEALKRLLSIKIKRANAYAEVASMSIKFVNDGITDTFNSEEGWITLDKAKLDEFFGSENPAEIIFDAYGEDIADFYDEFAPEDVSNNRKEIDEKVMAYKEEAKKEKEAAKKDKKSAKKEA